MKLRVPLAMVHPKTGCAHAALGLDLVTDGKKLIALPATKNVLLAQGIAMSRG